MGLLYRAHPWHGVTLHPQTPEYLIAYIEIVPSDTVKYELDKATGILRVDRPQRYSNVCPSLYGLLPQTLCGDHLAHLTRERTGRSGIVGDGDPLDICVLTEKDVPHGDILMTVTPLGGFRLLDRHEADDKIIAVLKDDAVYGSCQSIEDLPSSILERLKHYFLTYKQDPDNDEHVCEIADTYGREEAHEVIRCCRQDYQDVFGNVKEKLAAKVNQK
ncbi:MAG: inorganic pyrophosphatase [Armatimonadetes bacterium]|nr:inorganic pyrophosphatase [Armatimonadota bacterium]